MICSPGTCERDCILLVFCFCHVHRQHQHRVRVGISKQPGKGSLVISFTGLLNLLKENTVKATKWLKLSKLISRSGYAASAKSCLRKIFKYNYNKQELCRNYAVLFCLLWMIWFTNPKLINLETLLRAFFVFCHHQPGLAGRTRADSSIDHNWSWMHPVHCPMTAFTVHFNRKSYYRSPAENKYVHLPDHESTAVACSHE